MARAKKTEPKLSGLQRQRLSEIEACERRGEALNAYAARRGLSVRALYEAKRQARRAGLLPAPRAGGGRGEREAGRAEPPRFVEAMRVPAVDPSSLLPPTGWRLRLPGGAMLESGAQLDAASIERILAALGARS